METRRQAFVGILLFVPFLSLRDVRTVAFISATQKVAALSDAKGKPANSEFIALIADKLQLQLKSSKVANF